MPKQSKLTPKQLAEMTDEQIVASASSFSYDVQQCDRRLWVGGDWNRVIQAHLFYDHVLTKMAEEALVKPEHIRLDRMTFAGKLDLCAALGLISEPQKGFLREVNKVRNSIAHDLDFKLSREQAKRLYEILPPFERDIVDQWRKKGRGTLMYATLLVVIVNLDISRQRFAAGRLLEQKGHVRLRHALDKAQRVLSKS